MLTVDALVPGVTTVTTTHTGVATSYTSPIVWYVQVSQPEDSGGLTEAKIWGIIIGSYFGFAVLCGVVCNACK